MSRRRPRWPIRPETPPGAAIASAWPRACRSPASTDWGPDADDDRLIVAGPRRDRAATRRRHRSRLPPRVRPRAAGTGAARSNASRFTPLAATWRSARPGDPSGRPDAHAGAAPARSGRSGCPIRRTGCRASIKRSRHTLRRPGREGQDRVLRRRRRGQRPGPIQAERIERAVELRAQRRATVSKTSSWPPWPRMRNDRRRPAPCAGERGGQTRRICPPVSSFGSVSASSGSRHANDSRRGDAPERRLHAERCTPTRASAAIARRLRAGSRPVSCGTIVAESLGRRRAPRLHWPTPVPASVTRRFDPRTPPRARRVERGTAACSVAWAWLPAVPAPRLRQGRVLGFRSGGKACRTWDRRPRASRRSGDGRPRPCPRSVGEKRQAKRPVVWLARPSAFRVAKAPETLMARSSPLSSRVVPSVETTRRRIAPSWPTPACERGGPFSAHTGSSGRPRRRNGRVRAESHRVKFRSVVREAVRRSPLSTVPELHRAIGPRGCECASIGAERHGENGVGMLFQGGTSTPLTISQSLMSFIVSSPWQVQASTSGCGGEDAVFVPPEVEAGSLVSRSQI